MKDSLEKRLQKSTSYKIPFDIIPINNLQNRINENEVKNGGNIAATDNKIENLKKGLLFKEALKAKQRLNLNLRERYNEELRKGLEDEAKKEAISKGSVFTKNMLSAGNKTYNDEGQTLFIKNVKVDKLPKLDFENSVLNYATQPSLTRKVTKKLVAKQSETEIDTFSAVRGDNDFENYFFEPKIEQEKMQRGVKFMSSEILNGVKINIQEIENPNSKNYNESSNRMTLKEYRKIKEGADMKQKIANTLNKMNEKSNSPAKDALDISAVSILKGDVVAAGSSFNKQGSLGQRSFQKRNFTLNNKIDYHETTDMIHSQR